MIWGMTGTLTEAKLSSTHRIYRIEESEIHRLWGVMTKGVVPRFLPLGRGLLQWPFPGSYLLEAIFRFPKAEIGNLAQLLSDEEARSLNAMRLSGVGSSAQSFAYENVGFFPLPIRFGIDQSLKAAGWTCELSDNSFAILQQLWPVSYRLSLALRDQPNEMFAHTRISAARFSSSFDKKLEEDRLIDYFIAFEALFTKENDAISYRLPLRAALFIEDDAAQRAKTFDLVRAGYDLRSNLAHGKSQLVDVIKVRDRKVPVREFMDQLREVLFRSVHRFAACSGTKDTIIRAIDESAVSQDRTALRKLWG